VSDLVEKQEKLKTEVTKVIELGGTLNTSPNNETRVDIEAERSCG